MAMLITLYTQRYMTDVAIKFQLYSSSPFPDILVIPQLADQLNQFKEMKMKELMSFSCLGWSLALLQGSTEGKADCMGSIPPAPSVPQSMISGCALATIWKIEMKFKPCNLHGKISGPQKQPHEWP